MRHVRSALGADASAAARAAEVLRAVIGADRLREDVSHHIAETAGHYHLPPHDLRAALTIIDSEGLVAEITATHFRVRARTASDVRALLQLRVPLEASAFRRIAASPLAPESFDRLEVLARDTVAAAQDGNLLSYINADMAFHLQCLGLTGNVELLETVRVLRSRSKLNTMEPETERQFMIDNSWEHLRMVELLRCGDADEAGSLIARHILRVLQY